MKKMIIGLVVICSVSAFADCQKTVEKEIRKTYRNTEGLFYSISADLVKIKGTTLKYNVTVDSEYNDGSSTQEFPREKLEVTATGNASKCSVQKIAQILKS